MNRIFITELNRRAPAALGGVRHCSLSASRMQHTDHSVPPHQWNLPYSVWKLGKIVHSDTIPPELEQHRLDSALQLQS